MSHWRHALESADVDFIDEKRWGSSVRLRKRQQKQRWSKARRRSNETRQTKSGHLPQREAARKVLRLSLPALFAP